MDLRISSQRVHGFYVYKSNNGYDVGLNGTAIHKSFKRDNFKNIGDLKSSIMSFIYANLIVKK